MRKVISINSDWRFKKTDELPASLPEDWERVDLPHTWNAVDGQDGGNDYWRGTACYCRAFGMPELEENGRAILEINGAAMSADVYLNGRFVIRHEGGYSAFRADVTDMLEEKNLLCVKVDNSANDRVYPQKADFTFYGGLYRDVNLILVPEKHFELCENGTPGMHVTVTVNGGDADVLVSTRVSGGGPVSITVDGVTQTAQAADGHAEARFVIRKARLWDGVNDPYLYTAEAEYGGDRISCEFGCRFFSFDPEKGFFLNGHPYPLRGVARHQDRKGLGNALTVKEHEEDIKIIREMGANTIRLAHYQHAQEFMSLCDRYGIVVWAEIPYITAHMPNGRENTLSQMRELVTQCYNHPSVVCWGLSNEITFGADAGEDLLENHRLLNELCHELDPTRPTVMAHVFMLDIGSPLIPIADLASYNLYFGWYVDGLDKNEKFFDEYHRRFPERIIGFSEYGADANVQYQGEKPERGDYSEGYQCLYHEHLLHCIEERPYLWATHVWNMFDFAADGRDEGGKHGENQKGLVTFDRKIRKDAYYLYKAAWSDEKFVHLCGRRYVERENETTEVKVYSNLDEVTLFVDGKELETKSGKRIFRFTVSGAGEHVITARAGELEDEMRLVLSAEKNMDYLFNKKPVANWFDREVDESCYSLKDSLGDLSKNSEAAALTDAIMAKARASRGDVAQSAAANEGLQRMMAGMSLETLLKQAGDAITTEEVKALNAALQKIKKQD